MSATEKVVNELNVSKLMLCNPKMLTSEMCFKIGQVINGAIDLLKEQKSDIEKLNGFINGFSKDAIVPVRCKDCKECYFASNRIQIEQTFACGKHGIDVTQDWFCADGERKEGR